MAHRPKLIYTLPARTPGSFGNSTPGRALEWVTSSWFRFGSFLLWLAMAATILGSSIPIVTKIGLLLVSPIVACIYFFIFKIAVIVLLFVPKIGPILGWLRVGYYFLFSRFVVEKAPDIDTPAWFGKAP